MDASRDSFGFDRSLLSALGHAKDDPDRFLQGCMKLAERSYEKVSVWFRQDFSFLGPNDRDDAMHDFYLILAKKLMPARSQENIHDFAEDSEKGKLRFRGYLYVTAKNAAKDFAKKQMGIHIREQMTENEIAHQAQGLMSDLIMEDAEIMLAEIKSLAKVSDHEWKIFIASLQAPASEVASKLRLNSAGAVHTANHRVRDKLAVIRLQILKTYGHVGTLVLDDAEKICNL